MIGSEQVGLKGTVYRWCEEEWLLILRHSITHSSLPEPLALLLALRITRTPYNYGGWRYWLRCPMVKEQRLICRRRVAKLFLVPDGSCFGCRGCLNLTFTSVRESHPYCLLRASIIEAVYGAVLAAGAAAMLAAGVDQSFDVFRKTTAPEANAGK